MYTGTYERRSVMPVWKTSWAEEDPAILDAVLKQRPDWPTIEKAAARAKAFSDPTRLQLLAVIRLSQRICVSDLGVIAEVEQSVVSHHLARLKSLGLVRSERWSKLNKYSLSAEGHRLLNAVLPP